MKPVEAQSDNTFVDNNHKDDKPRDSKRKTSTMKKYIFFDFKCTQDDMLQCSNGYERSGSNRKCINCNQSCCGTFEHKPNLCVAHKVCDGCLDMDINTTSICHSCGKNEKIFTGETTVEDFCRWLFLKIIWVLK